MRLVLLSGGIDSTALLLDHDFDAALFVDYGQPARHEEIAAASRMADRFGIDLAVMRTSFFLGPMGAEPGAAGARVVPGRNAMLIALGTNFVSTDGPHGEVFIGCHADDAAAYPDCKWRWLSDMDVAMSSAYGVRVFAPLITDTKRAIRSRLAAAQIEFSNLWSCYSPQAPNVPCGTCNSCRAASG